jgi:hypothetical protein
MHSEIDSPTAKLTEMSAAQQAAVHSQATSQDSAKAAKNATGPGGARSANGSKQMKQLQAQLADQKKQLLQTQEDLAQTRTDLEANIASKRNDLNGSIARTHEELVALAKRGERNYFEFDLAKTKQFERSGPISLSLRKADAKHNRVDLQLIVDDSELSKKSVNLYEPVWIHRADDPQPIQVVINKIERNRVHGYVSAPKYRQSELENVSY